MSILANAPVQYSGPMTSASGTGTQIIALTTAGVNAGYGLAGNFYLDSPSSNLLNGIPFRVKAAGWIKAHGATQTVAVGLQVFPWNTSVAGARTASGTATFTPVASGSLTAGTYYDFYIQQEFVADANANTLTCLAPTVYAAGSSVSISSVASAQTVAFASSFSSGTSNTVDYPLASFVVSFANSVSDTTQTLQLTQFIIEAA